jgi:hypothetical protein
MSGVIILLFVNFLLNKIDSDSDSVIIDSFGASFTILPTGRSSRNSGSSGYDIEFPTSFTQPTVVTFSPFSGAIKWVRFAFR